MRAWGALVAMGICVLVGAATAVSAATDRSTRKPDAQALRALQGVNFVSSCGFSHRRGDDPIVFPGRPGLSHDHTFVGNRSTNAFSTVRSLRAAGTTCRRAGETAAYWMPTLTLNGLAVEPRGATIYYRRRTLESLRPFPAGLKMIAGNSRATAPQDLRVTYWNCGAQAGVRPSASIPTCPDGRTMGLRLHVNFPNCWDGAHLDSQDHQSHMAYSMGGRCPATHPVPVPAISLIYRYPIAGGAGLLLASGGQFSAHADFFNAWQQGTLVSLVQTCLNALRHCGRGV
jgi:Domain of unknown function (DUF1996)